MAKRSYPAVLAVFTGLLACSVIAKYSNNYYSNQMQSRKNHNFYGLETTICKTTPGLSRNQKIICDTEPDTIAVALLGMNQATKECQFQFQNHRWNCSSLSKAKNLYSNIIFLRGFKETAFAHAISSAGVVVAVAKACASGALRNCYCDKRKYGESSSIESFKWSGCSHNLNYGVSFSRRFLGSHEDSEDIHSIINLNNNKVGVKIVRSNMEIKCKCHGLSGSCQMKTCWRAVPEFRVVGQKLMEKYYKALMFDQPNINIKNPKKILKNAIRKKKKEQLIMITKQFDIKANKILGKKSLDLVYYEHSPNFCDKDSNLGILGTTGRFCNATTHNRSNSCSVLCCGRGHNLIPDRRVINCNCKFIWCCKVECNICQIDDWVSVCK